MYTNLARPGTVSFVLLTLLRATGAAGCTFDSECSSSDWCNGTTSLCVPKVSNLQALPVDPTRGFDGTCNLSEAGVVCVSGVCDVNNHTCGFLDGDGSCSGANGATTCDSGLCATSGPATGTCIANFAIDAPTSVAVNQGASNSQITIATTALNYPVSVALSASGLPDGVTPVFDPATVSTGSSSNLTLTADPTVAPIDFAVITITGTIAYGTATTTFDLSITDIVFRNDFEVAP